MKKSPFSCIRGKAPPHCSIFLNASEARKEHSYQSWPASQIVRGLWANHPFHRPDCTVAPLWYWILHTKILKSNTWWSWINDGQFCYVQFCAVFSTLPVLMNLHVDCWQSVFLSIFSLKENGTRHGRGTHEKKNRLQPLLMFLRTFTLVKII